MTKKLLIEGYRPNGREVFVDRGFQGGFQAPSGTKKPPSPPSPPPNAPSAVAKPKPEK